MFSEECKYVATQKNTSKFITEFISDDSDRKTLYEGNCNKEN